MTKKNDKRRRIVVIGAGAAGLMAACAAAEQGAAVTILEKTEKAGKKIYITGKGRCNLTNACDIQAFWGHVVSNPKFLYSAVYGFDARAMMQFMEDSGCPVKIERGDRVFPVSDHASDVTKALLAHLRRAKVEIRYHCPVQSIEVTEADGIRCVTGVKTAAGERVDADAVILAVGGRSYPSTGSEGDGYRMARELGIEVVKPAPSLVPLRTREDWCTQLQGLALKNVELTVDRPLENGGRKKKKPLYEGFGEMLFTHFGISGPLVLTASCYMDFDAHPEGFTMHLNLKPALTEEQITARIRREIEAAPKKKMAGVIRTMFPARLAELIAGMSGLSERVAASVNDKEIAALTHLIQDLVIHAEGTRGFNEAIVTRGGLHVKAFDPSTMQCKEFEGLYAAGEVLDVDAHTGGFNLQIAWSTGRLAGESAALD
jgi:predicted Rossmann fold flavoprotein